MGHIDAQQMDGQKGANATHLTWSDRTVATSHRRKQSFVFFLSFFLDQCSQTFPPVNGHSFIHIISFARAACLYVLRTCVHLSEKRVKYQQREKYPDYERRLIE